MAKERKSITGGITRRALLLCGFVVGLQAVGYTCRAAVYTVPGSYSTIQSAINAAPDGSTIIIENGTYTEELRCPDLKKNLYIRSRNGPDVTILDGGMTRTLLYVQNDINGDPARNVVIDGFTFQRGRGAEFTSPITIADARPKFLNCKFINNTSLNKAGAALIYGTSAYVSFVNCSFISNMTDRVGGAVLVNGGHAQAVFKDCLFEYNSNRSASGLNDNVGGCLYFAQGRGKIIGCRFNNNSAAYAGGAIVLLNSFDESFVDTLDIIGCTFVNNFSQAIPGLPSIGVPTEAGAIHIENNVLATISGCYFSNNWAEAGGAIGSYRGNYTIWNSVFDGNRAVGTGGLGGGGAISFNNNDAGDVDRREAVLQIYDTVIRNCRAPSGCGLSVQGDVDPNHWKRGKIYLRNVVFDNNTATVSGSSPGNGAGFFFNLVTCWATNLYVLNNHAEMYGGAGVIVQETQLYLYDSFIVGNHADSMGQHGIHDPDSSFVVYNNTLQAYNGEDSTTTVAVLAGIPPVFVKGCAWLSYILSPYSGSPNISSAIGGLPNLGGYAAGSVMATGLFRNTGVRLSSSQSTQTVSVAYTIDEMTNAAFLGQPVQLPARVEAENFDNGGEGVSYHDTSSANDGGSYRTTESVDIAANGGASNGRQVGWINSGEWLEYTVYSPTTTLYRVDAIVAAAVTSGQFYVQIDGVNLPRPTSVPNTGGLVTWQPVNVGTSVRLTEGSHVIRVVIISGDFNFDYLDVYPEVPMLACSVTKLYQTVKKGTNALSQSFFVYNTGAGELSYTISTNVAWLTVTPSSGSSAGEQDSIRVAYQTAAMATGEYAGTITIDAGLGSPKTVNVTLIIRPNAYVQNDFDGDARSDLGVYYPPGGYWYIYKSSKGFYQTAFGYDGTVPITGDFDNDGLADFGCYYSWGGNWHMFTSKLGYYETTFGYGDTVPITGDFDGDGKTDFGCYDDQVGGWYIFKSREGFYETRFGYPGTVPITGDFDGDGKCDFGCYDDQWGGWYIFKSKVGFYETRFGYPGTVPITGDFDGDGKCDFGCYDDRVGGWYIFKSKEGFYETRFGFPGTWPITGDFDGDGKCDFGVYYPPTGKWYVFRSRLGYYEDQFGYSETIPLGGSVMP